MNFLDYIFPKRCVVCKKQGSYLCSNCFINISFDEKQLCLICDKSTFNNLTHPKCEAKYAIDGCFSALSYNKTAQKLIYNFKYKPYLEDLKNVLSDLFYESIIQNENFMRLINKNASWIIIPVPLSPPKLRKRGYNQSEVLAKELGNKLNLPIKNLLIRARDTKTQVGLSDIERKLNMKNAFKIVNGKSSIVNLNVFLLDDIVTTGSTLKEAARVLKRGGAKKSIWFNFG